MVVHDEVNLTKFKELVELSYFNVQDNIEMRPLGEGLCIRCSKGFLKKVMTYYLAKFDNLLP
jgi:hypothetical protein